MKNILPEDVVLNIKKSQEDIRSLKSIRPLNYIFNDRNELRLRPNIDVKSILICRRLLSFYGIEVTGVKFFMKFDEPTITSSEFGILFNTPFVPSWNELNFLFLSFLHEIVDAYPKRSIKGNYFIQYMISSILITPQEYKISKFLKSYARKQGNKLDTESFERENNLFILLKQYLRAIYKFEDKSNRFTNRSPELLENMAQSIYKDLDLSFDYIDMEFIEKLKNDEALQQELYSFLVRIYSSNNNSI